MTRKELLKNLELIINIVPNPDHPNVLLGPDILGTTEKKIFGFFFLKSRNNYDLDEIQIKLAETTLNYPSKQLNYLVLLSLNIEQRIIQRLEAIFDKVIDVNQLLNKNLYKEEKKLGEINNIKNAQLKYINQASIQFNYNYKLITNINFNNFENNVFEIKNSLIKINKAHYNNWVSDENIKVKTNIYEINNKILAFKKFNNKISDKKDIEPFYKFGIFKEIEFDNKHIEVKNFKTKLLEVDKIPIISSDPLKLVRILSGAGWKFAQDNELSTIINNNINEKRKK